MEKTVTIDGKEVRFRASASVPRLYRIKFRRDLIVDMANIHKQILAQNIPEDEVEPQISTLPLETLETFENIAYIMAKHGDPLGVPSTVEEWLERFDTFSIYSVFPVIADLWAANMAQINAPQKK